MGYVNRMIYSDGKNVHFNDFVRSFVSRMLIGLFYETACLFVGYFIVKDVSSVYIFLCGNFHYFLYLTTKLQLF